MTTSENTVALLPRVLDTSELDMVAAGSKGGASFGGIVGFVVGGAAAIAFGVATANPFVAVAAWQLGGALVGVIAGEAAT